MDKWGRLPGAVLVKCSKRPSGSQRRGVERGPRLIQVKNRAGSGPANAWFPTRPSAGVDKPGAVVQISALKDK
ncbi:UNVERIFIED_CONTAM: hypothetical protein Sangu_1627400 [Sesamum angustifolium]|uniref:Uncharacterized protein n=1 Tax=Sesamum angustifolium TaxID=2727405 RepID=A0AAW2MJ76_9LAMI